MFDKNRSGFSPIKSLVPLLHLKLLAEHIDGVKCNLIEQIVFARMVLVNGESQFCALHIEVHYFVFSGFIVRVRVILQRKLTNSLKFIIFTCSKYLYFFWNFNRMTHQF